MKPFVIDTTATIVFFTVIAGLTELFIAGMHPQQVLIARLIMIPVMVVTGRPYGLWRDWLFARIAPQTRVSQIIVDIVAFIAFQVPVYVGTLVIAGASWAEISAAVAASIVFMILLSRPFGLFLDWVRRMAGTQAS